MLELLPHLSRLVPMADKYLSSKTAEDGMQQAELTALRGDVRTIGEAQAGLRELLAKQNEQVAELAVDVAKARMSVESMEARVAALEKAAQRAMKLILVLVFVVGVLGSALILVAVMLAQK